MNATAIAVFTCISSGIFVTIFLCLLPLMMSGEHLRTEERAHKRRLADARMNARLLRFNL